MAKEVHGSPVGVSLDVFGRFLIERESQGRRFGKRHRNLNVDPELSMSVPHHPKNASSFQRVSTAVELEKNGLAIQLLPAPFTAYPKIFMHTKQCHHRGFPIQTKVGLLPTSPGKPLEAAAGGCPDAVGSYCSRYGKTKSAAGGR